MREEQEHLEDLGRKAAEKEEEKWDMMIQSFIKGERYDLDDKQNLSWLDAMKGRFEFEGRDSQELYEEIKHSLRYLWEDLRKGGLDPEMGVKTLSVPKDLIEKAEAQGLDVLGIARKALERSMNEGREIA